ncbi:MAG: PQQ-binding-like beta-propeller repeat protein [Chloroflexi bacterium]|nr:PQQ-binding-like beta-propeller repeat protein [Chloroflexota bacterium]
MKSRYLILLITLLLAISRQQATLAQTGTVSQEWTQDAHDAQRTGYIPEEPLEPWRLLWTWNGPDANGGAGGHAYDAPREARTITGGSYVYVPAGSQGLYALSKLDGRPAWNIRITSFNATPAYDPATGYLYANGADGRVYKIDTRTGAVLQNYNAGNPLNKSVLLVGQFVYAVTDSGQLHKVNTTNMTAAWVYSANAPIATPPAYSPSRDLIIYATNDLYVHGVKNADGQARWRVKPTPNPAGFPNEFDGYWPVVAEQPGVVFLRMRLNNNELWSGPGKGGMYPNTNAEIRAYLQSRPQLKNLFALSLDTGQEAFIPAVGYGGVEDLVNGSPYIDVGPVPVVRVVPGGKMVAYQLFRSGQSNPPDGRWDSHLGEMVLDNQTVPNLVAGDLRFVQFTNSSVHITDEQTPLTMAGDTIFYAHWGISSSTRIIDRSSNLGLTYSAPIRTQNHPGVIRRMTSCSSYDKVTHWTTCNLALFGDTRSWTGPGWWVYWNVMDPPTPVRSAYSEGLRPRYTYVSDGLVIVEGNGGELFVLKHSGTVAPPVTPAPVTPTSTPPQPTATPTLRLPTATPTPTTPPPSPTRVLPTVTPTSLPVTPTRLPPTATPTGIVPAVTATTAPSTASPAPPSPTPVQTQMPSSPALQVEVVPPAATVGATVDVTLRLLNVNNVYGVEVICRVDPAVLKGSAHFGGDGFNDNNSFFVDQGFRSDGSWTVAATRVRPQQPINGSIAAFGLRYTVLSAGSSSLVCAAQAASPTGRSTALQVINGGFNQNVTPTPSVPTATVVPATATSILASPTAVQPTATVASRSEITGTITYPGLTDHSGINVTLVTQSGAEVAVSTGSTGTYRFTDVPVGTYLLRISAPQALAMEQAVQVQADGSVIDLGTDELVVGDVDGSAKIDLVDATYISANYGVEASLAPNSDLNRDSQINIADLVLVGSSFDLAAPVPLQ